MCILHALKVSPKDQSKHTLSSYSSFRRSRNTKQTLSDDKNAVFLLREETREKREEEREREETESVCV